MHMENVVWRSGGVSLWLMDVHSLTFLQQISGSDLQAFFIYTAKQFSCLSLPYSDIKINIE